MSARARVLWSAAWWVAVHGCIIDKQDPCGAGQVKSDETFVGCVCPAGSVPNADGVGCHACAAGEVVMGGRCVAPQPDAGSADAGAATGARGEGEACSGPEDCAGFDATYCQMLQQPFVCLVQGCVTGEHRCTGDRVCCDWSALSLLADTHGLCVPAENCLAPGKVVSP